MSPTDNSDNAAALRERLAAVEDELRTLQSHYHNTLLDLGQILRGPDRIQAGLEYQSLSETDPVFHRSGDPPMLRAMKRIIFRLVAQRAEHVSRFVTDNPNKNPHKAEIEAVFGELCDEALVNKGKLPGRDKLMGLARRRLQQRGIDATVSQRAAGAYLRAYAHQTPSTS